MKSNYAASEVEARAAIRAALAAGVVRNAGDYITLVGE